MNLNDYQQAADKTATHLDANNEAEVLAFVGLCLAGEAGELANRIKKIIWHGYQFDKRALMDELGDLLWYTARAATLLGVSLDDIAEDNLVKLQKRYPDGFYKRGEK